MIGWIVGELISEIIIGIIEIVPKKIRLIIGTFFLIIGILMLVLGWMYSTNGSGLFTMLMMIIGFFFTLAGLVFFPFSIIPLPDLSEHLEEVKYIQPEDFKKQINCPPCGQLLNIPRLYTGDVSCPMCKEIIGMRKGIILLQ